MKNFLFYAFLFLVSCSDELKTLPSSTGSLSEIIFVVEDALWEQEISSLVLQTFGAPIQGINQIEASYRIIQINYSEFKSLLKTHKNIVLIAANITESSQKNKWAKDQLAFQLNWSKNITATLEKFKKVKSIFEINEIQKIKLSILKTSNKKATNNIKENFNIDVIIPNEYLVNMDTSSLFWATYNPQKMEEIKHLFVFSFKPSTANLQEEVLQKTDSIFSYYLLGSPKESYVKIEPLYPPLFNDNIYRGLWKLENGFMGGPFLIKTYFIDNKVIVTVGLIFAPQSRKRNYIKTLEAIL